VSVGHKRERCKKAEPIEMPFGVFWTWVGPSNHVLGGGSESPMGRNILGVIVHSQYSQPYSQGGSSDVLYSVATCCPWSRKSEKELYSCCVTEVATSDVSSSTVDSYTVCILFSGRSALSEKIYSDKGIVVVI